MTIEQIIAAADTTSNTWVGQLTNGTTEAILTFAKRTTADSVAMTLKEKGCTVKIIRTEYKQYILQATWTTK